MTGNEKDSSKEDLEAVAYAQLRAQRDDLQARNTELVERVRAVERALDEWIAARAACRTTPAVIPFTEERRAVVNGEELRGGEVPLPGATTPEALARHVESMVCSFLGWPGNCGVSDAELIYRVALGALRRMRDLAAPAPARRPEGDPRCSCQAPMDPTPRLTPEQIAALRPFLRCLVTNANKEWVLATKEFTTLYLEQFVALHKAFRPFLTFSDVYSADRECGCPYDDCAHTRREK